MSIELKRIKVTKRPDKQLAVVKFEMLQRIAYDYFLSIEEDLIESLDKDIEVKLWEMKKVMSKESYRKQLKIHKEKRKKFIAKMSAYKTKVEQMQKIFERGGEFHNNLVDEKLDIMFENMENMFEMIP